MRDSLFLCFPHIAEGNVYSFSAQICFYWVSIFILMHTLRGLHAWCTRFPFGIPKDTHPLHMCEGKQRGETKWNTS